MMKKYKESIERFKVIDGDNFGPCQWQHDTGRFLIQHRIRQAKNENYKCCIIQFFPDGAGYTIYSEETA